MDEGMQGRETINSELVSAVRNGKLKPVRELMYSLRIPNTLEGYNLLVHAIKKKRSAIAKLLIRNGAKLNSHYKDSNTPLVLAVMNGDIGLVKLLLDRGADIHVMNTFGYTPLHLGVMNDNAKITKMLLDRGADVHIKNTCGYTPLHCAVKYCSEEVVSLLINSNVNVDVQATDGTTPLHIAAEKGFIPIAKVLLNHGADIHFACTSTQWEGYMPIHFSTQQGSKEDVRFFLSKGADVNANTKDNLTPLHFAVKAGNEAVVKLLLECGAKVDAPDKSGNTILHLAVEKGNSTIVEDVLKYRPDINNKRNRWSLNTAVHGSSQSYKKIVENLLQYGFMVNPDDVDNPELLHNAVAKRFLKIVRDLLKYGADVNVKDKRGHTPLYYAIENIDVEITKLLSTNGANIKDDPKLLHTAVNRGCLEIIENLFKYGADVNAKDERGKTPVFYAVRNCNAKITELLLINGADIKDRPELLHTAVRQGCLEIIENLLMYGADVNMMDFDNSMYRKGYTPLHSAAEHMKEDVVKLLLNYGANVNAKDQWGKTPLVLSVQNSDAKITKLLLTNGVDIKNSPDVLQIAAAKGCLEIVKDLLKYDPDVNYSDKYGRTALYLTVLNHDFFESLLTSPAFGDMFYRGQIVELLLRKGANVNAKPENSIAILHIAAERGYWKIVEILLKFGADVDFRDKYGRTALYIAIKGMHEQVVNALLEYGSDINITSEKNHTPLEYAMLDTSFTYDDYAPNYGYNDYDDYDYYDGYDYDSDDSNHNRRASVRQIVELLKKHISKLKAIGLYVSERNLELITDDYKIIRFLNECKGEIEIMKGEKIGNSYASFYDILSKNTHQLAKYAKNENMVQAFESAEYRTKFRIYASMIQAKFSRGLERKELMELGNQFFYSFFESFPVLPLPCIENIFSYLSNNDLKVLHRCV